MTRRWIITVLGKDRPGIVAGVTKMLYELGCNLEDSAMTRLEGEFTIMLIFSSRKPLTEAALQRAFAPLGKHLRLVVHAKPLTSAESRAPRKRGKACLISVYGADKPGIVYRVADALAKAKINISDVHTHRSDADGPSLYMLLLEVELPGRGSAAALEQRLRRVAKRLGVQVSVRPSDPAVL
jgi:glycine cleavage system transcriptional repressor